MKGLPLALNTRGRARRDHPTGVVRGAGRNEWMSTRIRVLVVGAALAALSLLGAGSAQAGNGSESTGSVQNVQPAQQEQNDGGCPFKESTDVSQQV
jgi:hypothetical protein